VLRPDQAVRGWRQSSRGSLGEIHCTVTDRVVIYSFKSVTVIIKNFLCRERARLKLFLFFFFQNLFKVTGKRRPLH
jgi:hypothetical protein